MNRNIRLAHFVHDSIYVDFAYDTFEMFTLSANDFYIVSKHRHKYELSHIRKAPLHFINRFSCFNPFFIHSLQKYDIILFHSMKPYKAEIAARLKGKTKLVWIGMGYDYYDFIYPWKTDMLKEETLNIYRNIENNISRRKKILKTASTNILFRNNDKKKILSNIDYFCPVLEEEYHLISKSSQRVMPKYIPWNYDISSQLRNMDLIYRDIAGNNILVGNSATYTNNHIDAFKLIQKCDIHSDSKIVCPLNYGSEKYLSIILAIGDQYFSDRFYPLLSFLEFKHYIDLLRTCSNAIMNHIRQQAGGNILIMLFLGAKVFLDKRNPFYEHYKNMGVKIFSTEDLQKNPDYLITPLDNRTIAKNKHLLRTHFNINVSLNQTYNLINTCIHGY